MADKRTRVRALSVADEVLAPRKEAFAALVHAANAAQEDTALTESGDRAADRILQAGRDRARKVMNKAREDASQARQNARKQVAERMQGWRDAYAEARAVGWSTEELEKGGQPQPPRGKNPRPTRRRSGNTRRTGRRSAALTTRSTDERRAGGSVNQRSPGSSTVQGQPPTEGDSSGAT